MSRRISPVIPGFGLTLGYTLVYLSLLVLIPLGAMFLNHPAQLGAILGHHQRAAGARRAQAELRHRARRRRAQRLDRHAAGLGSGAPRIPGRKIIDAMIDLPFALPTAVAGIALTALYAPAGPGRPVRQRPGFKIAYTPPLGITLR